LVYNKPIRNKIDLKECFNSFETLSRNHVVFRESALPDGNFWFLSIQ